MVTNRHVVICSLFLRNPFCWLPIFPAPSVCGTHVGMQEDDAGVAEVKVAMPFTLKKQLVTDWENVTHEPRRLVKLPREVTAADVMSQYMEGKAKRSTAQQTARAQELMDGVRIYFDKVSMSLRPS